MMETCRTCGASVVVGSAHAAACSAPGARAALPPPPPPPADAYPYAPPRPSAAPYEPWGPSAPQPPPAYGAWPPPPGTGGYGASNVDAFADGLAPFLGDPTASRGLGRAMQVCAGLLALYTVGRAAAWANLAALTSQVGSALTSPAQRDQILAAGQLVDSIDILFWPTLIGFIVVDLLWRRKRRPKAVLQSHGEAYVEATITRVIPVWYRVMTGLFVLGSFLVNMNAPSPRNLQATQVSGFATTRALSSLSLALGWATFIGWVWLSERHLARRVAKAADPLLAGYSVPYVMPEKERGTAFGTPTGESEGIGWFLRTGGLILAAMVALIVVIASIATFGSDPLASLAWLVGSGAVLGLVVWAFVRRFQRNRASAPAAPA